MIVLWYHLLTKVAELIYQDCYTREWMHKLREKHYFDRKSFEWELKRPIKEYDYQSVVEHIIPICYVILLFFMLVFYLAQYGKTQMSMFEYIYAICLCFAIGGCIGYFIYDIYHETTMKSNKTLQQVLDDAMDKPEMEHLYGTWIIDCSDHSCLSFTLKKENIMEVDTEEMHKLAEGCCSHGIEDIYNSCIVGAIQLPLEETQLRCSKPLFYRMIKPEAYKFILHKNKIIKFVPIGESLFHKLGLARLDSKGWYDTFKNIKHANKYSCFCLGILCKDGNIKRYNRWNTDLDYFYTATKQTD